MKFGKGGSPEIRVVPRLVKAGLCATGGRRLRPHGIRLDGLPCTDASPCILDKTAAIPINTVAISYHKHSNGPMTRRPNCLNKTPSPRSCRTPSAQKDRVCFGQEATNMYQSCYKSQKRALKNKAHLQFITFCHFALILKKTNDFNGSRDKLPISETLKCPTPIQSCNSWLHSNHIQIDSLHSQLIWRFS